MDYKEKLRRIPLGILVGLVTLMLASGGAVAWLTWRSLQPRLPVAGLPNPMVKSDGSTQPLTQPTLPDHSPDSAASTGPNSTKPAAHLTGQIYWLTDEAGKFKLVPQPLEIASDPSPSHPITTVLNALLTKSGDTSQNTFTTIPADTRLLEASVRPDGIHLNLSASFSSGGGSASMVGRLGQVIYTATSFDPNAAVWIEVEGKPLTLLGGEGLEVNQPISRAQFDQAFNF